MARYVLKRVLMMIPVLIAVVFLIFTIMYFTPGDPAEIILGTNATDAQLDVKREQLGLNDPYIVQLGRYLYNWFVKFDLGKSWVYGTDIATDIIARFPTTVVFALICMAVQLVIGIPLGVTAAVHQNGIIDKLCMALSIALVAIPGFWLAMMMIILFSVKLQWLPPYGTGGLEYYIMPVIAACLGGIAGMARQSRSCMLEVLRSDYVMMAQAKGLPKWKVLYRHALPNGMIPLLTMIGGSLAGSLGGTMIIENVFSIPGMGMYMTKAVTNYDYPVVRAVVVFLAILFSMIMLLVDISYGFADPRIRAQYADYAKNKKRGKKAKEEKFTAVQESASEETKEENAATCMGCGEGEK